MYDDRVMSSLVLRHQQAGPCLERRIVSIGQVTTSRVRQQALRRRDTAGCLDFLLDLEVPLDSKASARSTAGDFAGYNAQSANL